MSKPWAASIDCASNFKEIKRLWNEWSITLSEGRKVSLNPFQGLSNNLVNETKKPAKYSLSSWAKSEPAEGLFLCYFYSPSALNLILSHYATEKVQILEPENKILIRNVLLEDFFLDERKNLTYILKLAIYIFSTKWMQRVP